MVRPLRKQTSTENYQQQQKKEMKYLLSSPTHDIPGCDGAFGNTEKENYIH